MRYTFTTIHCVASPYKPKFPEHRKIHVDLENDELILFYFRRENYYQTF